MNILLVGGAGYVGSVLSHILLSRGYRVRIFDSLLFPSDSPLLLGGEPSYELIKGDIRDTIKFRQALYGIDVVIFLSALVGDAACARSPETTRSVNEVALQHCIDSLAESSVRFFLFFSTCSNYGVIEGTAKENSPLNPLSLYARTKVNIETYIQQRSRKPWIILRLSTVYGPSARMRFDLTVNEFTLHAHRQAPFDVYLPDSVRPYIHVYDAGLITATLIQRSSDAINQIINIGFTEENYSKREVITHIQKVYPHVSYRLLDAKVDLRDYRVDFSKLQELFHPKKTYTLSDGIHQISHLLTCGIPKNPYSSIYRN